MFPIRPAILNFLSSRSHFSSSFSRFFSSSRFILSVESSCDDSCLAIFTTGGALVRHLSAAHWKLIEKFGGVNPIESAREHAILLPKLWEILQSDHRVTPANLAAVAVTAGPGLQPCLIEGMKFSTEIVKKSRLAQSAEELKCHYYCVNHLLGHSLIGEISSPLHFPYLALILSGGHSEFQIVRSIDEIQIIGETLDDSAGECFDKVARSLGVSDFLLPGESFGAALERKSAEISNEEIPPEFDLPQPLMHRGGLDFSFSGLKTASLNLILRHSTALSDRNSRSKTVALIAASFQRSLIRHVNDRVKRAISFVQQNNPEINHFVFCGGVAANSALRSSLQSICSSKLNFVSPSPAHCGDNAIMIGRVGIRLFNAGIPSFPLDFSPLPRLRSDKNPRDPATLAKPLASKKRYDHIKIIMQKIKTAQNI